MESKDLPEIIDTLEGNWQVDMHGHDHPGAEQLLVLLAQSVLKLLQNDVERLLQTMYRMDIREDLFKAAMLAETDEKRASNLAQIILEREKQRLEIRKKYRNKES